MATDKEYFDIGQMVHISCKLLIKHWRPLLVGTLILFALNMAGNLISIGILLVYGPLTAGLYAMTLSAIRGQSVALGDIFHGFTRYGATFLAGLIIALFTLFGLCFCIIPGILVSLLYSVTYLFIIDEDLDFWPAMEASRKMVMNNFWQWLLLFVVCTLLNIAGVMTCCVGILFFYPLSFLLVTLAYEQECDALAISLEPPLPPEIPEGA